MVGNENTPEEKNGKWQNNSNLHISFIELMLSIAVKKDKDSILKSCESKHTSKETANVSDLVEEFKNQVIKRIQEDIKIANLESDKEIYEEKIKYVNGKREDSKQLEEQLKIKYDEKIAGFIEQMAKIEELTPEKVFLSNDSKESGYYLQSIKTTEAKRLFENKDKVAKLSSNVIKLKNDFSKQVTHKQKEVENFKQKIGTLKRIEKKNRKPLLDKKQEQLAENEITPEIINLSQKFIQEENYEIMSKDTSIERIAKTYALRTELGQLEEKKNKLEGIIQALGEIEVRTRGNIERILVENKQTNNGPTLAPEQQEVKLREKTGIENIQRGSVDGLIGKFERKPELAPERIQAPRMKLKGDTTNQQEIGRSQIPRVKLRDSAKNQRGMESQTNTGFRRPESIELEKEGSKNDSRRSSVSDLASTYENQTKLEQPDLAPERIQIPRVKLRGGAKNQRETSVFQEVPENEATLESTITTEEKSFSVASEKNVATSIKKQRQFFLARDYLTIYPPNLTRSNSERVLSSKQMDKQLSDQDDRNRISSNAELRREHGVSPLFPTQDLPTKYTYEDFDKLYSQNLEDRSKLDRRHSAPGVLPTQTDQISLPDDFSELLSISESELDQFSMPENFNRTLDEIDSVKKSVSVEDLKLAYVERLRAQVAFVEQKIKHDEELKKYGSYNNFFLDQSKKAKEARAKIEDDLTGNKNLCDGLKKILGDEKKLAEFLEEIQLKDPQVLANELENVKLDTAELKEKVEELKEITYKDLKKKWYQVLTRPSFYLFLARQALWVAPMAFFSAMAGALPLMPTGTQLLHGTTVVNWLRGVIIGSYVGQCLVNAVPKIIPRTSKRVHQFAKERFPKTVATLEKGSKAIARPFKSIGKSVRSTAQTIGRPLKPAGKVVAKPYNFGKEKLSNLKAKTLDPIGKKIKETFDIAHSEKRSPEENQNLKKGLDANGQRLPFATRVKNAALMTTTNFAKRLWRNKVKTLIGVALFVGLATFGLPLLLTAALPAISGTLIASVAAVAVPALFTLLGVWVADKYLLKPLQNRLANRENAKREQLFTERSAKVQELGQHHSLTPDFNKQVARVVEIDKEKQTAEKQERQTSQKMCVQESDRMSISSISALNTQTKNSKPRLADSINRVLNDPIKKQQRESASSKNSHQRPHSNERC